MVHLRFHLTAVSVFTVCSKDTKDMINERKDVRKERKSGNELCWKLGQLIDCFLLCFFVFVSSETIVDVEVFRFQNLYLLEKF